MPVNTQGNSLHQFKNEVATRFQLYNSLFTSLPFHRIEKTGVWLSLLSNNCDEGFENGNSPEAIIADFFESLKLYKTEKEQIDILFRFVQYVERQVVLFDAIEDAAFPNVHDLQGSGTLKHLISEVIKSEKIEDFIETLKSFTVRLVLTAHPTQFYPGPVLGIIHDLSKALTENNTVLVNELLQQLGRTPFLKKVKPTPRDEAISLIWFLENVFYPTGGLIINTLKNQFPSSTIAHPILQMGFWPGGDRDGNPFVTADTTLKVADDLRGAILKCYYLEVRKIKRRLTFQGLESLLKSLEEKLYNNLFLPGYKTKITKEELINTLEEIRTIILNEHNGLFVHLVERLINKIQLFGLHFATLDIRQHSKVHGQLFTALADENRILNKNYNSLSEAEKINKLLAIEDTVSVDHFEDDLLKDTLNCLEAIQYIQNYNGELGCNRYIISQCTSALHAIEVFSLFKIAGWDTSQLPIDIVPLFETITDLENAATVMETLYKLPVYRNHLAQRKNTQTIMLGFSDGTKDGGYLMANWAIYKAKQNLTAMAKQYGISIVFFDGRGGPPSRGGGKTHRFYASLGKSISNEEIQLTIQGQTISSSFGTVATAGYNIGQLLNAGITNAIFSKEQPSLSETEEQLLQELANISYVSYLSLRDNPYLMDYLVHASPLRFYGDTNIGSRPMARGQNKKISLEDLRAIPFAGSWSQLKQNVTGFYGVGTALKKMEEDGKWEALSALYDKSLYFKTLLDNCEMSMTKSYFPLTQYLQDHPTFGDLWQRIYEEYQLTKTYVLKLANRNSLMENYPVDKLSIAMREKIVLPLLTIQQYALTKIRAMDESNDNNALRGLYEKLVMRCSFGIINAGRNSA